MATIERAADRSTDSTDAQDSFGIADSWEPKLINIARPDHSWTAPEDEYVPAVVGSGSDRDIVEWNLDAYIEMERATYPNLKEAAKAWRMMEFAPKAIQSADRHGGQRDMAAAVIEQTDNVHFLQYLDGAGEVIHDTGGWSTSWTTRVIRTVGGHIIVNGDGVGNHIASGGQGYTAWYVECVPAGHIDVALPLNATRELLEDRDAFEPDDIYDIGRLSCHEGDLTDGTGTRRLSGHPEASGYSNRVSVDRFQYPERLMAHLSGNRKLAFFEDPSGRRDGEFCLRTLNSEEAADFLTVEDLLESFKPQRVQRYERTGMEVVPATGDADVTDDRIYRQGDYYFIPKGEEFEPASDIYIADPMARPALVQGCDDSGYRTDIDEVLAEFAWYSGQRPDPANLGDAEELTLAVKDEHGRLRELGLRDGEPHPAMDQLGNHTPDEVATAVAAFDGGDDEDDGVEETVVRGEINHQSGDHDTFDTEDQWVAAEESPDDDVATLRQSGLSNRSSSASYD